MGRSPDNFYRWAALDQLSSVHDKRLVGEIACGSDVMSDIEHGEVALAPQLIKQRQYAQADRHVQHGHRLVRQEHRRLRRQCSGNRHTLALSTGQLMGVLLGISVTRRQANLLEELRHTGLGVQVVPELVPVDAQRAFQMVTDRVTAVQRTKGVLKYKLHFRRVLSQQAAPAEWAGMPGHDNIIV
jgi:hypothetical protein